MFKKVDGRRMLNATDQFLEEVIEMKSLVHRNRIMKAIRKLRIRCGLDDPISKKKLTKEERKHLESQELENYSRHLDLTDEYTKFAKEYMEQVKQDSDEHVI